MSGKLHKYEGEAIVVTYDAKRCIHAAECVRGLPHVFDPRQRRWVQPDAAAAESIAHVVMRCPTGALHFERKDGDDQEPAPESNVITLAVNGPLYLRGNVEIIDADDNVLLRDTRVALCRCGASENKPFCDGNHALVDFEDPAAAIRENNGSATSAASDRNLVVQITANGPMIVQGALEIRTVDGRTGFRGTRAPLCRCGASSNKPFCDGSHSRIGFVAG